MAMTIYEFAQVLGFQNEVDMYQASETVAEVGDISWYITRLPDGRWAAWDDAEIAVDRVEFFAMREEAVAYQRAGLEAAGRGESSPEA